MRRVAAATAEITLRCLGRWRSLGTTADAPATPRPSAYNPPAHGDHDRLGADPLPARALRVERPAPERLGRGRGLQPAALDGRALLLHAQGRRGADQVRLVRRLDAAR